MASPLRPVCMTMSPPTARVEVTVFTCSGLGSGVFSGSSVGGRVPATTGGAEFSAGALGFTRERNHDDGDDEHNGRQDRDKNYFKLLVHIQTSKRLAARFTTKYDSIAPCKLQVFFDMR